MGQFMKGRNVEIETLRMGGSLAGKSMRRQSEQHSSTPVGELGKANDSRGAEQTGNTTNATTAEAEVEGNLLLRI